MKFKKKKTPFELYESDLEQPGFSYDPVQRAAVLHTQRLYDDLLSYQPQESTKPGWFKSLFSKNQPAKQNPIKGLYFWGGVGRGKTYLVDNFFNCLPFEDKTRIHFHSFMLYVHGELRSLKDTQDPLSVVADRFAKKSRIICFDEFHVSDITDAMLLGTLFEALFKRGITLVATSNEEPSMLYSGGLQRERFLPAIAMIQQNTDIVEVDNGIDYRFRLLDKAEIYHSPLDSSANKSLLNSFKALAPEIGEKRKSIEILGRKIKTVRSADGIVWFEFREICGGPRSAADYIDLARIFQTVFISNIPILDSLKDDQAKRFMTMIDEFYDRNVKVIISAEVMPTELYKGSRLEKSFRRTISRLQEMSSTEYLKMQHISE